MHLNGENCKKVILSENHAGLNINDFEKSWIPGAHMPPPRGNIRVYHNNIQTSSPLKPHGQSKPNFM